MNEHDGESHQLQLTALFFFKKKGQQSNINELSKQCSNKVNVEKFWSRSSACKYFCLLFTAFFYCYGHIAIAFTRILEKYAYRHGGGPFI